MLAQLPDDTFVRVQVQDFAVIADELMLLAFLEFPQDGEHLQFLREYSLQHASLSALRVLYTRFGDFDVMRGLDYGCGARGAKDAALVRCGELALYTLCDVGTGCVFLTSPLLPNFFAQSAFSRLAIGFPHRTQTGSFTQGSSALQRLQTSDSSFARILPQTGHRPG